MRPSVPNEPDNAGQADGDSALGDLDVVDIGVGASTTPHQVPLRTSNRAGAPARVVAIVLGLVLAAALLVGLVANSDDQAQESSEPSESPPAPTAPTSPPEVLDSVLADPARPGPTPTVQVPVVNRGVKRAGEECRVRISDDWIDQLVYTVPDGRTLRTCSGGGDFLVRDPGADTRDVLGDVFLSNQPLGHSLNVSMGMFDTADVETRWEPVNGRRAYRLDVSTSDLGAVSRLHLIEVPGGTVFVSGRNEDFAPGIGDSIDQLVGSIRVDGPQSEPPPLPTPGGWCAGEHYVTQVPDGWFAGDRCRWLNSSSESPQVLQCECLPPLWVEHVTIPFDGDFGFSQVDIDRLVQRDDGSVIRIIEGLRRDPNNMDRPLRAVVLDGGIERVVVIAAEFPEHVLPGHDWQDTLDAQQLMVQQLRFHSQPGCGAGEQLIASRETTPVPIRVGSETVEVPIGTALNTTGCVRTVDGIVQREVRLVVDPSVIGWVDAGDLASPEITLCDSGEGSFRPTDWDHSVRGDFDGDGRLDTAYTRTPNRSVDAITDPDIAVLFANGGVAAGIVGGGVPPLVERLVGMGRDLIRIDQSPPGSVTLHDAASCTIETVFGWTTLVGRDFRTGVCRARIGVVDGIRTWQESLHPSQGWVREFDAVFTAGTVYDSGEGDQWCGPFLSLQAPVAETTGLGTGLSGQHRLTLQWITSRSDTVGSIEFRPLGNGRYEVAGAHTDDDTNELSMTGLIEVVSDDELRFEGTISTRVTWLNEGNACVRSAGQRFVRRPGTDIFRLQDRINCDGARTDWIDIALAPS